MEIAYYDEQLWLKLVMVKGSFKVVPKNSIKWDTKLWTWNYCRLFLYNHSIWINLYNVILDHFWFEKTSFFSLTEHIWSLIFLHISTFLFYCNFIWQEELDFYIYPFSINEIWSNEITLLMVWYNIFHLLDSSQKYS